MLMLTREKTRSMYCLNVMYVIYGDLTDLPKGTALLETTVARKISFL